MRLQIVSWDGDTSIVHEGTTFKAWLPDEATGHFSQVAANVNFLKQQGATPTFLAQTPNEWYFPLVIQIVDRTQPGHTTDRDTLAGLFPTSAERNQEKILVVKDIDDNNKNWQVTGTPFVFKYKKDFIRIIIAVAEPRWIETDQQSDTFSYVSGVGHILSPEPKGNIEFDPILEITPSTQRASANSGEEISKFVEVVNPAGQPALFNFAIDLSDGGWNHATDVTNGDSLANGDDIRVTTRGYTINRWIQSPDTASAKLWTHIDLPASKIMRLGVLLTVGGSETEVILETTIAQYNIFLTMPNQGQFKIGTERFTYTGKNIVVTNASIKFTGVKRAVLQSTKAAHAIGDSIIWIPYQIWVHQGDTTVVDSSNTEDADEYKPIFELTSTNLQWIYDTEFFDSGHKRSWSWINVITQQTPTPDNITLGETIIFTDNEDAFTDPATVLGQKIAAVNDPYSNGTYKNSFALMTALIDIPFGIKAVTVEGRKARQGTEWGLEHALWYSRGLGDWLLKWNDTTIPVSAVGVWEDLGVGIEATLKTLSGSNGFRQVMFVQKGAISGGSTQNWYAWQIDKITLDFNANETPTITDKFAGLGTGTSVVELKYVIENTTTGDSVEVRGTFEISDTLILDFETFEFYILSDNQKLPLVVMPTGDIDNHWFRLKGGVANTLKITDTGMPTTSMVTKWNARYI